MPIHPLTVVAVAADTYTAAPSVALGFEPDSWTFFNESIVAADVIMLSFDGIVDHGKLVPGTAIAGLGWDTKMPRLWLRRSAAGAAVNVTVMAGSIR